MVYNAPTMAMTGTLSDTPLSTILMKYHALFVIFEKAATLEMVVCWKL